MRRVRRRSCPGRAAPSLMPSWGGCSTRKSRGSPSGTGRRWCFATSRGVRHDQAARHLGWPVGTVKSRLSRGRQRLRDRLIRRGLAPNAGLLPPLPGFDRADASVPTALVDSTTSAAVQFAAGGTIVPGSAVLLAQGVLRSMSMIQWLKIVSVVLVSAPRLRASTCWPAGERRALSRRLRELSSRPVADGVQGSAVKPGKLRLSVAERGSWKLRARRGVLPGRGGHDPLLSIVPDGTDSRRASSSASSIPRALRDNLRNQKIPTSEAAGRLRATPSSPARSPRSPSLEYVEGIYKSELANLTEGIAAAESAVQNAEARLDRTRRTCSD